MNHTTQHTIPKPKILRLAYWESCIGLRSFGVQITLIVFSLLLCISTVLGILRTTTRQNQARIAAQENQTVKTLFLRALQGTLESNEPSEPDSEKQARLSQQLRMTARSPYLMSHAANLWNVSLFPSPLSALSVGNSNTWPDRYRIQGLSLSKTIRRSDDVRPVASVHGPFDTVFMVMVIAPLVIIGLTFNAASRDRESALQNLVVAQTPSLGKLMALRCFVRAGWVIGLVVCIVNGSLLLAFGSQFDGPTVLNMAIWNIIATLYLLVWAAFSLFVNSFGKSSAANGGALLLLWLVLVLIIPRLVSNAVENSIPTQPENQLADLEQTMIEEASEQKDKLFQRFNSEHPEIDIRRDDEQQIALAEYLLAHRHAGGQASENVSRHYSGQAQRGRYLNGCRWLSPAISFRTQSDFCSGNSEQAFIAFTAWAAATQSQLTEAFLPASIANQECTLETIAALPELQNRDTPKRSFLGDGMFSIGSLTLWWIILTALGIRGFHVTQASKADASSQQSKRVEHA